MLTASSPPIANSTSMSINLLQIMRVGKKCARITLAVGALGPLINVHAVASETSTEPTEAPIITETDVPAEASGASTLDFHCAPGSGEFYVSISKSPSPNFARRSFAHKIDWENLLIRSKTDLLEPYGDSAREGSKTIIKKCGPFTLTFKCGYFNANPQGRDGAFMFPIVEIRKRNRPVLNALSLFSCTNTSYTYCNDTDFAESIEAIRSQGRHKILIESPPTDESSYENNIRTIWVK
jgi:hypothetical protein